MKAIILGGLLVASASPPNGVLAASKKAAAKKSSKPHMDLGTTLEGVWFGDVTSDMHGSSRSNVTLTITRSGPNTVTINSDYKRLPVIIVPLESAIGRIVHRTGNSTIFYDPTVSPPKLDVVFNGEVAWAGHRKR
jgi:hypothetical protein